MIEKPKRKNSANTRNLSCLWLGIAGLLCLGAVLGFYFSIGRFLVGPPIFEEACELHVSENIFLKIESYACDMCGHPRYYEVSHDAGETWTTFYTHLNNDDPRVADCSEFQIYSSNKFYFIPTTYHPPFFIITNDAGINWHVWKPDDTEYPDGIRCNTIAEVSFHNERNGSMRLTCSHYDKNEYLGQESVGLWTPDGGETWEIPNE